MLASVIRLNGEDQVLLQELPGGRVLPLPPLRGHGPHRSPSLSWNGRYVAVILQRGARRQGVVLDRLSGRLQPLPTPAGAEPEGLSLAPDGQRIAMAVLERGRRRVRLLNLSGLLEPDQPPGQTLTGGGPP